MRLSQSSTGLHRARQLSSKHDFRGQIAQCFWHPPVDELHFAENKQHKIGKVLLTPAPVALCSLSFFDSVPMFSRLVVSPGLKRAHIGHRRTWKSSANPVTAVAGDQGRRSRDAKVKALASPANTAVLTGTQPGARKGDRACRAQLFRCSIVARQLGHAPDAIRRRASQVALTNPRLASRKLAGLLMMTSDGEPSRGSEGL
jgi:hypothetical protein